MQLGIEVRVGIVNEGKNYVWVAVNATNKRSMSKGIEQREPVHWRSAEQTK